MRSSQLIVLFAILAQAFARVTTEYPVDYSNLDKAEEQYTLENLLKDSDVSHIEKLLNEPHEEEEYTLEKLLQDSDASKSEQGEEDPQEYTLEMLLEDSDEVKRHISEQEDENSKTSTEEIVLATEEGLQRLTQDNDGVERSFSDQTTEIATEDTCTTGEVDALLTEPSILESGST
ncbi:uncharacterized protein LOC135948324 isoform X2 [Cloeon dipterum]|uniref:uncharacterized protein LOC135948324 isoform X2 n=1 Tax=Cloeon dipterum TaxID=197152 RepID=UPI00322074BD